MCDNDYDYDDGDFYDDLFDENNDELNSKEKTEDHDDDVAIDSKQKAKILEAVWEKTEGEAKAKMSAKRTPRPILTEHELTADKGLLALKELMDNHQFSAGSGPYEKLDVLLNKVECWAHHLFPPMNFDDCLEKLEKLGHKRAVKNMMKQLRLGMALDDVGNDKDTSETNADKISLQNDDVLDNPVDDANEEDLDEFLNKYGMTKSKGADENIIIQMREDSPTNSDIASAFRPSPSPPPTKNAENLDSGDDSDSPLSTPIIAKKRRIIIEDDDY